MTVRTYRTEIALVLVTAGAILLMALLNDINRYIRIKEIRIYMQQSNREENNIDHMGLVMKYRIHKRLYENQINNDEADLIEARVNSILAGTDTYRHVSMERYRLLSIPTLFVINFMRAIMGKPPIRDLAEDTTHTLLEVAYYYERNNYYAKALEVYDRALRSGRYSDTYRAGIILHQGYCHSILGDYDIAREKYMEVVKQYGDTPVAVTALILLRYLEGFRSELERVVKSEPDSVEKSEKLYRLIAYREAMQVMNRVEKTVPPAQRARLMYLKGRCYEDLSEKEKAIDAYQGVVTGSPESPYARMANRRIFIAGTMASNGDTVKNMAVMNNQLLRDPVFETMTEQDKKLRLPEDKKERGMFIKELRKEEAEKPALQIDRLESRPMVDLAEETIKKQMKYRKAPAVIYKVVTSEGNLFVGPIQQETKQYIVMKTMLGFITIPRDRIVSRETMK
ncbi:MAG: tetratricopeptide repeat protein [Spirochaetes bacterium]|nr:tetratricopeptide repeat protein [Spirochaetota bacterium]